MYAYFDRRDVEVASSCERPPSEVYRDLATAAETGWDFSSRWWGNAHGSELQKLAHTRTTQVKRATPR